MLRVIDTETCGLQGGIVEIHGLSATISSVIRWIAIACGLMGRAGRTR
jgi:hypothetical protein